MENETTNKVILTGPEHITAELKKFNVPDAAIAEFREKYMPLKIEGVDDKAGYKAVHEARMTLVRTRVNVDKVRKALNEDALTFIKAVNGEAKRITEQISPIEEHLLQQQDAIDAEKDRIATEKAAEQERLRVEAEKKEAERVNGRIKALGEYGFTADFDSLKAMSDEDFQAELAHAKAEYDKDQAAKAEAERLRKEEEARMEKERAELDKVKAEQERVRKEQEEREQKIKDTEAALARQQQEIEDQKHRDAEEAERIVRFIENQRLEEKLNARCLQIEKLGFLWQEGFSGYALKNLAILKSDLQQQSDGEWMDTMERVTTEVAKIQAQEQADRLQEIMDAEQRARLKAIEDARLEAEAKEKAEAAAKAEAARQEALRPDKEKLEQFANSLTSLLHPEVQSEPAKSILASTQTMLEHVQASVLTKIKDL